MPRPLERSVWPPTDGSAASWVQQSMDSPAPVAFELAPIEDLVADAATKANVRQALAGYCGRLKSRGVVTSCAAPPADKPFPKPAAFPVQQLKTLLHTFTQINPSSEKDKDDEKKCKDDNNSEWATIRGKSKGILAGVTQQNFPDMMRELLTCLESVAGSMSENKPGWADIGQTCEGLMEDAQPAAQFWSLVKTLEGKNPTKCNKGPWAKIRATCQQIRAQTPSPTPQPGNK